MSAHLQDFSSQGKSGVKSPFHLGQGKSKNVRESQANRQRSGGK